MTYPHNFEHKIGFNEIRSLLNERCMCALGRQEVADMHFSDNADEINMWLQQNREFRRIIQEQEDFPLMFFFDMREGIARLRLEGTHMEEEELWNLKRSLETIHAIIRFLNVDDDNDVNADTNVEYKYKYPALQQITDGIRIFPNITRRIAQVLNEHGKIKDSATPELARIRQELSRAEGSISRTLNSILHHAQQEGLVDKDVAPTLRDGRLVIPVAPAMKRKINGIVHDESASGRTVFIEPQEVVEANNRIRELEADERREVIKILKDVAAMIRPYVHDIAESYRLLAEIDFIRAKSLLADSLQCYEPEVLSYPTMDFIQARHPLLQLSLERHAQEDKEAVPDSMESTDHPTRKIVPLDIMLTEEKRMLIISGPNAGGKSVCLKTTGLLQYMLQCGISIPVGDRSKAGTFSSIMIDIGDEQSLSDDLSTYSGHLTNMKMMLRGASASTLILIDEFGTGTEPQIGGAIAESVLMRLCQNGTWGIVTTHYRNLKEFADRHDGVANGAMLYDRHEMRPLFQLAIGRPGSSFAVEIARKIGLPEDVIQQATDLVGQDYIQSDKYLQDIVRDKRYWQGKRETIHQREKDMEKTISHYADELEQINRERKQILSKAKQEAQDLLAESRKRIEQTIKEIREAQAEKEETKRIRQDLHDFENAVNEIDAQQKDEAIERKIAQIKARQQRREDRKKGKLERKAQEQQVADHLRETATHVDKSEIELGDTVRIKGTKSVGTVDSIIGKNVTVIFGGIRTKIKMDRLEHAIGAGSSVYSGDSRSSSDTSYSSETGSTAKSNSSTNANALRGGLSSIASALLENTAKISRMTRETMDNRQKTFSQEIDLRGMRGDEALMAVQDFIDDAILVGVSQVRILHGKGNGILRQLIRQYLSGVPNVVSYHDEDIRFGGTGITVAEF